MYRAVRIVAAGIVHAEIVLPAGNGLHTFLDTLLMEMAEGSMGRIVFTRPSLYRDLHALDCILSMEVTKGSRYTSRISALDTSCRMPDASFALSIQNLIPHLGSYF